MALDSFGRFSFLFYKNVFQLTIIVIINVSNDDLSLDGEFVNDVATILYLLYTSIFKTMHGKMEGFQIFEVTYDFQKLKHIY